MVAGLNTIEPTRFVGDHARENIEPPGRAFRISGSRNVVGQCETFQQRHDVDAAGFENCAVTQRNFVQLQSVDALGNGCAARQETRPHAVGHLAQTQIEARRLDLIGDELVFGQNTAVRGEHRDHAVGQNALVVDCEGKCHGVPALQSRRSNPRSALTGSRAPRYKHLIPWSFEPAGLQPR